MDCKETQHQCHPYLDQQIEVAQRHLVDEHLAKCPCCKDLYEAQRAFLGALKKLVHGCGATCAPEGFQSRIRASLTQEPGSVSHAPEVPEVEVTPAEQFRVVPAPRRSWRLGPAMAAAASIMLALGGLIAGQTLCLTGECPIALAAEREHQRILAGAHPVLVTNDDPDRLKKAIRERMADFPGLPSLCNCHLNPVNAGVVKIDGLPEGAFIQYAECKSDEKPVTLMVINTSAMSKAEVLSVRQKEFHYAMRSDNSVISWRSEKDGMLYILVTSKPIQESIKIAEVARR